MNIFSKWALALIVLSTLTASAQVSVSSPSDGATVGSPVHVVASANAANGIAAIRVWVDNNSVYLANSSSIDTNIPMSLGSHYVVVQAWDNSGNPSKQVMTINVAASATPTSASSSSGAAVNVTSPSAGQTVGSPTHFVASATQQGQYPVTAMQVYVDDQLSYSVNGAQLDTYLNLGGGSHNAVVKSWNTADQAYSQAVSFTVGSSSSPVPAPAPTPSGGPGVTVTSPSNGGSSGSSIHVVASAQASGGIAAMQIYLDDNLVFRTNAGSLDSNVNAGTGSHNLVVQAWDNSGAVYKQPVSVSVTGNSAPSPTPTPAPTPTGSGYYDIDQLSGWDSCNSCAGPGGVGPQVSYSLSQWQGAPSIDGQSAQFWLGGGHPYSGALWWKELAPKPSASHFTYDLYFNYQNANAPQALEFDVNQVVNGGRYIFGTECNLKETGTWRVWDTTNAHWVNTGVVCSPSANNWNHMTWEFQRNLNGSYTFLAVTLNGQTQSINQTYWSKPEGGDELNVAVQLDSNYAGTDYSVWVDKIALNYY
ncbi:MAG TPA: Ig-like domain-containing protein [Terriglobales bacterium]|nr:Ig-like domain-containing protein [Terriglobales bacterium]